jgi:hypothetical protein
MYRNKPNNTGIGINYDNVRYEILEMINTGNTECKNMSNNGKLHRGTLFL